MDIPLWNVGFYLVDLISKMSGFCWEELCYLLRAEQEVFQSCQILEFCVYRGKDFKSDLWLSIKIRFSLSEGVHPAVQVLMQCLLRLISRAVMACRLSTLQVESSKALVHTSLPYFVWLLHAEQGPVDLLFKMWNILVEHCSLE